MYVYTRMCIHVCVLIYVYLCMCILYMCIYNIFGQNGGHWISWRNRRTSVREMLMLQGMDPNRMQQPETISDRQMGALIGNAFTQTVARAMCIYIYEYVYICI